MEYIVPDLCDRVSSFATAVRCTFNKDRRTPECHLDTPKLCLSLDTAYYVWFWKKQCFGSQAGKQHNE